MKNKIIQFIVAATLGISAASAQDIALDARTKGKSDSGYKVAIRVRNSGKEEVTFRLEIPWMYKRPTDRSFYVSGVSRQMVTLKKNEEKNIEIFSGEDTASPSSLEGWVVLAVDAPTGKVLSKAGSNPTAVSVAEARAYVKDISALRP